MEPCKEKEGREKGRTGAGAVKREGRSGTGVFARAGAVKREGRSGTEGKFRRLSEEQGGGFHKVEY